MMKKILLVFGTRPEAIKMAPVVRTLKSRPDVFDVEVCVTGQHRELLDQVLELFEIRPDYDLDIMKPNQDLFDITSRILLGMRDVLDRSKPDYVLVHGDTTTSMAAALAAFYRQIPVCHVEAGLRTGNIYSPWPEEVNRLMTGRIAAVNFAPTKRAQDNLLSENVSPSRITVTGNTVIDALHIAKSIISAHPEKLDLEYKPSGRRMVLVTGHRRENFGQGFLDICNAIRNLALKYPDVDFVYPMHLNPNVRKPVTGILGEGLGNVFLIEPLRYLEFVHMMDLSYLVLTDSGGVQEEAPGLGKPVLVMRDTTERPEAVEAGTVLLVGTDRKRIEDGVSELLDNPETYRRMSTATNPYGDGLAAGRIADYLENVQ